MSQPTREPGWIFALQILSVGAMWVFVLGISVWIIHLLRLSHQLNDVPSASVAISIVAIPVFLTGAAVLTYVFVGLRKGRKPEVPPPLIVAIFCTLGLFIGAATEAEVPLPDNPLQGRGLFEKKHCNECHGIVGTGRGVGPTLGEGHFGGSFLDLGAALWNHVPGMSVTLEMAGLPWPELTEKEISDLVIFLNFIDYLGRPGQADTGEKVFAEDCGSCHAIGGGAADTGPDLAELRRFASPLYIAQEIWNHGPSMFVSMRLQEIAPPTFEEGDLADLSAFIRQRAQTGPRERMLLAPGNPNLGSALFADKGCSTCHGTDAGGGESGPDLRQVDLHRSAEAIAGKMWNHASVMSESMEDLGVRWPQFEESDLADLVAFLYFLPFADPKGSADRGAEVYRDRSCADCHSQGEDVGEAAPPGGPVLVGAEATLSPAALVGAMWNHAPIMKRAILSEGNPWPTLTGEDLRDLHAYLAATSSRP